MGSVPHRKPSPTPPLPKHRSLPRIIHNNSNNNLYFALFLVVYVLLTQRDYDSCQTYRSSEAVVPPLMDGPQSQQSQQRAPRLGDGCYHVFLDVGANVGVHGRFLLEPYKYPHSLSSVDLLADEYGFDKRYGLENNTDVCVFAFEANPQHWPRLQEISQAYQAMGWKFVVVEAAVADFAGSAPFYHQGQLDTVFNEWGFSGAKDISQNYEGQVSEGGYVEMVPTIRLADWILYHIHEREIPSVPPSRAATTMSNTNSSSSTNPTNTTDDDDDDDDPRFRPTMHLPSSEQHEPPAAAASTPPSSPILGMKIDIEGYEYVVIPDLIHTGAICNFDFFFGEYHSKFAPITQFRPETNDNNPNNDNNTNNPNNNDNNPNNNNNNNNNNNQNHVEQNVEQPYHRISLNTTAEADAYAWCLSMVVTASRNCKVRWMYSDDEMYLYDGPDLPQPGDVRPQPKPVSAQRAKRLEKRRQKKLKNSNGRR